MKESKAALKLGTYAGSGRVYGLPITRSLPQLSAREAVLLAAVDAHQPIERQHKGQDGWHRVTEQEACDAVAAGDAAWFRAVVGMVPVQGRPSVVVYGPQGCGKTRNADALRQHFGLEHVRDLDPLIGVRPAHGTLFLTDLDLDDLIEGGEARRACAFEVAMQIVEGVSHPDVAAQQRTEQVQAPTPD